MAAIPILNHLDFRYTAEAQNLILHKTTEASATNTEGAIIYDTGTDTIKYRNGSSQWISLTGDTNTFRPVTAGGNTLGTSETLAFTAGTGITISESGGAVTITNSVTDTNTNQLTTFQVEDGDGTEVTISQAKEWKFVEGTGIDINWTDTSDGSDGDPYDLTFTVNLEGTELASTGESGGTKFLREDGDGTCSWQSVSTTDTVDMGDGFVIEDSDGTEVTITENQEVKIIGSNGITSNWTDTSPGSDADPYDLTLILDDSVFTLTGDVTGSGTQSGKANLSFATTIAADAVHHGMLNDDIISGLTELTSGLADADEMLISDGGTIKRVGLDTMKSVYFADEDVSITNLGARLPQLSSSFTIGDATDVTVTMSGDLVVTGDLTVSGDTITANVGTLNVEDKNIVMNYHASSDTSSTANGAGITIQDAVDATTDATILWDATNDEFDFSHKITVPSVAGSLILDGNTISGIDDSGEFTNDDNHIMTSAAVEDKILGYSYTTDANVTHRPITAGGNSLANGETLAFTAGSNVTITESGGAVTIASTDTNTDTNTQLSTAAALIDVSAMGTNTTASFTHALSSQNLIVQLYDTTTGQVVWADIDHTSNTAISINFVETPSNDIRVIVIDAKNGLSDKTVSYS